MSLKKIVLLSFLLAFPLQVISQETAPQGVAPLKGIDVAKTQPVSRSFELNEQGAAAAKKGDTVKAEQLFKQALIADSHNLTAVFNLAGVYAYNKKEPEAKKLLENYVKQQPKDPDIHARLGDINFSLSKPKDALKEYETALALAPKYPGLHAKMAPLYVMLKQPTKAENSLKLAIDENPNSAVLYRNYSAVLLSNKKVSEAIAVAKKSIQLEVSSEAYITLGTAYEISKDLKNALIAYQRASDLGDSREELEDKIATLTKALKK